MTGQIQYVPGRLLTSEPTQVSGTQRSDAVDRLHQIPGGELPIIPVVMPLAPDDQCHFIAPVRCGRRKSDQFGHLMLTNGWVKLRAAIDISIAWSQVSQVSRSEREIVILLQDSRRTLRFSCTSPEEAARGAVIGQHLATLAQATAAV